MNMVVGCPDLSTTKHKVYCFWGAVTTVVTTIGFVGFSYIKYEQYVKKAKRKDHSQSSSPVVDNKAT